MTNDTDLESRVLNAVKSRLSRPELNDQTGACRLFSGFSEGCRDLVIDRYADTLLFQDYSESAESPVSAWIRERAFAFTQAHLPYIRSGIAKVRAAPDPEKRRGAVIFGENPAREVSENGIRYALDLTLNRDAGFYLDTRNLRIWLTSNARGKEILNTFAYTGSLGIAAHAGGARQVFQLDRTARFLELAQASCGLNSLDLATEEFLVGDFFRKISYLKKRGQLLDGVILDPPFFAEGKRTSLDLSQDAPRLVNKVRPLVRDGGWIVVVNNALFLSGRDFLNSLSTLADPEYLRVETLIPPPPDILGFANEFRADAYPADPAPFVHSTKIAILRVGRRNQ